MFDRDHLMFSEKPPKTWAPTWPIPSPPPSRERYPESADESEPEMILVEPIRRGRETSEWQGTCVVGVVIMGVLLLHLCGVQELPDAAVTALCWGISGITAAYTLGRSIVKRGIVDVPRVEVGAGDGLRPGEMRRLMDADAHPLERAHGIMGTRAANRE